MTILKTFEHKGRFLQLASYDVERPAKRPSTRRAPGAGKFEITRLELSEDFTLAAEISGENIAYLFLEILLKDGDRYYGPVLRESIPADLNKETDGVKRPDWGNHINLSLPLRPRLTLLTDGVDSAFAFCHPKGYDVPGCQINGQFTSAESQFRARLEFDGDGNIGQVLALKERGATSKPHVLTPHAGDTFAPFVQILTEEDGKWKTELALSTPLKFGEKTFQLVTESPIPGEYLAGILAQDLDGGFTRKYVQTKID
jgi:hypothetical protein